MMGTFTGFVCTPAPSLGGYLYEAVSPQAPFFASFGLGIAGCLLFAVTVKEPERGDDGQEDLG